MIHANPDGISNYDHSITLEVVAMSNYEIATTIINALSVVASLTVTAVTLYFGVQIHKLSKEPNKKHQKVKWMAEEKEKYMALTADKMAQDFDGFVKDYTLAFYDSYLKLIIKFYRKNKCAIDKILNSKDDKDNLNINQILFITSVTRIVIVFSEDDLDLNYGQLLSYKKISNEDAKVMWANNVVLLNKKFEKVTQNDLPLGFEKIVQYANFILTFLHSPELRKKIALELLKMIKQEHKLNETGSKNGIELIADIFENNNKLDMYQNEISTKL
jgi:hypothetical protein